jgi:hypothetical protein
MLKTTLQILLTVVVAGVGLQLTGPADAAEWGSLKGRFVVDGTPPEPKPLVVTKDQYCIDKKPKNNAVVVGKDGALANAVVYLRLPRRGKVEVHPDYEAKLSEPVPFDNNGCSFHPHVALVRVGQPFVIKNSDPVGHNTNVPGLFNETIGTGEERPKTFNKAMPLPIPVNCGIHPFMVGHLLIQEHPYMAASAEDGTFEIVNLPAGKHEFQLWHEAPGYLKDLKFKGGKTNRQGRVELAIAAGQTLDLGDIKVPANTLKVR